MLVLYCLLYPLLLLVALSVLGVLSTLLLMYLPLSPVSSLLFTVSYSQLVVSYILRLFLLYPSYYLCIFVEQLQNTHYIPWFLLPLLLPSSIVRLAAAGRLRSAVALELAAGKVWALLDAVQSARGIHHSNGTGSPCMG